VSRTPLVRQPPWEAVGEPRPPVAAAYDAGRWLRSGRGSRPTMGRGSSSRRLGTARSSSSFTASPTHLTAGSGSPPVSPTPATGRYHCSSAARLTSFRFRCGMSDWPAGRGVEDPLSTQGGAEGEDPQAPPEVVAVGRPHVEHFLGRIGVPGRDRPGVGREPHRVVPRGAVKAQEGRSPRTCRRSAALASARRRHPSRADRRLDRGARGGPEPQPGLKAVSVSSA